MLIKKKEKFYTYYYFLELKDQSKIRNNITQTELEIKKVINSNIKKFIIGRRMDISHVCERL